MTDHYSPPSHFLLVCYMHILFGFARVYLTERGVTLFSQVRHASVPEWNQKSRRGQCTSGMKLASALHVSQ